MAGTANVVRIAAIGDLHCTRKSEGQFRALFAAAADRADILVLCGDLTDYGLPDEAEILIKEMAVAAKRPILAVLGNHDFESGRPAEVQRMFADSGVIMLDGDAVEVQGIGFAGAKGFAGGFGRGTLGAWGEPTIKMFVQEAIDEAMKLEAGWPACGPPVASRYSTTPRSAPPSRTSPSKSSPSWDAAALRTRSTAIRSPPWCTGMPTTALRRDSPAWASPCTTSRSRCSARPTPTASPSASSRSRPQRRPTRDRRPPWLNRAAGG